MTVEGRIIKGVGGLYTVETDEGLFSCKARGILRKKNMTPTIGDFVKIQKIDASEEEATIEEILPRKNELIRPKVSNIDVALLVFAFSKPAISFDLLDRFIVLAQEQNLEIVLCFNKSDLATEEEKEKIKTIYGSLAYPLVFLSAKKISDQAVLVPFLADRVTVLAGPSGVGKSSIFNLLIPDFNMEIGELSERIHRGKHTTRHAFLHPVAPHSYLVDAPGFTSVAFDHIEQDQLQNYFIEFQPFLGKCRFNNCIHNNEPDCAVKAAVGTDIHPDRYERYIEFFTEIGKRRK